MSGPLSTYAWQKLRAQVLATSTVCHLCGQPGADTVDHIVPRARGGAVLDPANLAPAHKRCNSSKGAGPNPQRLHSRDW